jgi:hypothetical protein
MVERARRKEHILAAKHLLHAQDSRRQLSAVEVLLRPRGALGFLARPAHGADLPSSPALILRGTEDDPSGGNT